MHAVYGGVVPEIASRKHVEAIVGVFEETLAQAQEMGLSVYLQLNEGGSAVLSALGTNMDGSWTAKDATTVELTFDGSSAEATLEGEELVMQQDGDVMRFKRGEIPPAASEVQRDENQAAEPEA